MWINDAASFSQRYKLTLKQAHLFKCTGEHLIAFYEGGASNQSNIVAACYYCNSRRHKPKEPLSPERYKQKVLRRMRSGKWHARFITMAC
ncbi:HNH endonuclease [Methylophaga sp.]|uniref:HNH endonuclease n=1 Tax=Methylophaga sp. TaxID=2024840 RepID=UPI0034541E40